MTDTKLHDALASLRIDRESEPGPRRGSRLRWAVLGAVVVGVVAAALYLLRPRAVAVTTAVAEEGSGGASGVAAVLNASGYVTARRQATVSSKFTGRVAEVLVEEGMRVEQGQVLARLDDRQERQAHLLAEAELEAARKAVVEAEARRREVGLRRQRVEEMVAQGISSRAEWDAVEAETDSLAARLDALREQVHVRERAATMARQTLEDTVIRAPFPGVAISKNAQPGEIISPMSAGGGFTRTGISTIVDMTSLEIEVDVNEAYIQRVAPGQRVAATLDAYPDAPLPAHVITTIPAADRQKATVTVRIGFEELDPRILPDMGVKVAFLADPAGAAASARPAVRVPRAAIRGSNGGEFVWVVGTESQLERRAVKLAAGGRDPAEVMAGLSAGERVVVEGPTDLAAGDRVAERGEN